MQGRMMLLALWLAVAPAWAGGDAQGGGVAAALKFTTNLGSSRYLQFEMVIDAATPEVMRELEVLRPRLQHRIILMLSEQTDEFLRTLKGKLELQARIQEIANQLIQETPKTGVKDVLFTSFIIQ